MPRRRRTPQEKKRLALTRDVVDMWGEPQKAFRKAKPRIKARASRSHRHRVAQALHAGEDEIAVRQMRLWLWPGPRLGEAIERKLERRRQLEEKHGGGSP
jgi:hypothetical protein